MNGELVRSLDLYTQAERIAAKIADKGSAGHFRAVALRRQGFALSELKRWDEATKAYQHRFKYEPDNAVALNELKYIEQNRPR
ncbi:MAG: hypothetical protein V4530_17660 [Pseudomonadota bacterium]